MKVKKLEIQNFRNISDISLVFDDEINVICGENAQGKTNIIEALWLFSGAKSFRNSKDNEFLKFGEKSAKISVDFEMLGVENQAAITFNDKKNAFLNDKKLPNTSSLAGKYNAIIFSPLDLTLVTDGPEKRRRFLDIAIGQLYPNYIEIRKSCPLKDKEFVIYWNVQKATESTFRSEGEIVVLDKKFFHKLLKTYLEHEQSNSNI